MRKYTQKGGSMEEYSIDDYIERVLEQYSTMIIHIAYQYVKNLMDAEDIAQEVFLKLISLEPDFENANHEKAWIIRVTINLSKDHGKSLWNKRRSLMEYEIPTPTKKEDQGVLEVVMELPCIYRDVIYLYYYEEMSIAEISKVLNKKEMTIGSLLHRGRKRLKVELKGRIDYV